MQPALPSLVMYCRCPESYRTPSGILSGSQFTVQRRKIPWRRYQNSSCPLHVQHCTGSCDRRFRQHDFPCTADTYQCSRRRQCPTGIVEVLSNLLLNIVANPVSSLVNANYVGILTWAILLGLALRTANDTTKKVLADIADGTSLVVSWIINWHPSESSVWYLTPYPPMD